MYRLGVSAQDSLFYPEGFERNLATLDAVCSHGNAQLSRWLLPVLEIFIKAKAT
jgi:hypothetical protein